MLAVLVLSWHQIRQSLALLAGLACQAAHAGGAGDGDGAGRAGAGAELPMLPVLAVLALHLVKDWHQIRPSLPVLALLPCRAGGAGASPGEGLSPDQADAARAGLAALSSWPCWLCWSVLVVPRIEPPDQQAWPSRWCQGKALTRSIPAKCEASQQGQ